MERHFQSLNTPFAAPLAGKLQTASVNRRPFQTANRRRRFRKERNVVPIQGIQACTEIRQHRSFCGEHLPASRRLGILNGHGRGAMSRSCARYHVPVVMLHWNALPCKSLLWHFLFWIFLSPFLGSMSSMSWCLYGPWLSQISSCLEQIKLK